MRIGAGIAEIATAVAPPRNDKRADCHSEEGGTPDVGISTKKGRIARTVGE